MSSDASSSVQPVVVGVPTARPARAALDWAAAEAQARHLPLEIVCGQQWDNRLVPWDSFVDRDVAADLRRLADGAVHSAIAHVRGGWPELDVTGRRIDEDPIHALLHAAESAALTVVGTRQLGPIGGLVLGSVSSVVAARASGPVVVLAGPGTLPEEPGSVVVGISGTGPTDAVLDFAFDHASRHGRAVHALLCWRPDPLTEAGWRSSAEPPQRAARWLSEALAGWRDKYPDVRLSSGVERTHPVAGLVAAAAGQDLLVVGRRGNHPLADAFLGSVTQGVLHRAECPVAVVS